MINRDTPPIHSGDNPGSLNLEVMENAQNYTSYIGRLVSSTLPLSGLIIDFGAGDGKQTQKICAPSSRVICIESDSRRITELRAMGYAVCSSLGELEDQKVACIFSINCIEHIADDANLIHQFGRVLMHSGQLVLFVPALPMIYSKMDEVVGHYRRYTKRSLQSLLVSNGFEIDTIRYVDCLGVVASFLFKMRSGASGAPSGNSIWVYDRILFPISRVLDIGLKYVIGKNLFVIARKT